VVEVEEEVVHLHCQEEEAVEEVVVHLHCQEVVEVVEVVVHLHYQEAEAVEVEEEVAGTQRSTLSHNIMSYLHKKTQKRLEF
jgi:hypothetical protein